MGTSNCRHQVGLATTAPSPPPLQLQKKRGQITADIKDLYKALLVCPLRSV